MKKLDIIVQKFVENKKKRLILKLLSVYVNTIRVIHCNLTNKLHNLIYLLIY